MNWAALALEAEVPAKVTDPDAEVAPTVATTVTIPDRGTLLVGGFGNHLEQATSTKIPFLGHIPFLGRLFGARGRYSVRLQLYLLTTVTVINYDELEANL